MTRREMILSELNKEQEEALFHFDSPLRIIAGAGSGKTRVLTRKIAYLITEMNVSPSKIVALTFTNKAANEMTQRIKNYINPSDGKFQALTFHLLCSQILREDSEYLGIKKGFQILDLIDQKAILKRIIEEMGDQSTDPTPESESVIWDIISYAKFNNLNEDELIAHLKSLDKDSSDIYNKKIAKIYTNYNKYLQDYGSLDFDDLIVNTNLLFEKFPEVAQKWADKFSYVMVDEFQDISRIQYEIVKKITGANTMLTIVGDPDQTIYTWKGADSQTIFDFEKDFPNSKTIVLNQNYRSTQKILDAANKLIKHNKKRFSKDLISTSDDEGFEITYMHAHSPEAEAQWVVREINSLKKQKIQLKNIAIFSRTNNYTIYLEQALSDENINHKILNGQKFYQRREIKDALAYLRLAYDYLELSLLRVINTPNRKINNQTLANLQKFAKEKNMSLWETLNKHYMDLPTSKYIKRRIVLFVNAINMYHKALENNKIHVVLQKMLENIGYFEYIASDVNLKGEGKESIYELLHSIKSWEQNNPDKKVGDYLESVSLLSNGDEFDSGNNYVTIMSVHSAKGLEFENIFIVGMSQNVFPHFNVLKSDNAESLEEERRLAYVALTRAKKRLFISDSAGNFQIGKNKSIQKKPSQFIKELGINSDAHILAKDYVAEEITDEKEIKRINSRIIVGDIVSHPSFGEGTVLVASPSTLTIKFRPSGDEKTIDRYFLGIRLLRHIGNDDK
ncbi:ATP-dependent helicase [Mycoplasma sp. HS2188]|uniref:ATP-dependent helicase n=1 Tax=Mycoplasma sp. HS2188 TaxID=2976765 RepID=UPI0021AA1041|nr:ATP-dependent helicase [Mycoplasma sp. HS2188]MCT4469771.1 ATP-dependent helicase [Mycoplasma sp. HS2188]